MVVWRRVGFRDEGRPRPRFAGRLVGRSAPSAPDASTTITLIPGDITADGKVDIDDVREMVRQWLQSPGIPSADIAPSPNGDGIVDLQDFDLLPEHYSEGVVP